MKRDSLTADLFAWEPPQVAAGYSDDVAGRGTLDSRIARLVGRALRGAKDNDTGRKQIAQAMSAYLGRAVSGSILDKWASEASTEHRIPLDAFIALVHATGETDLLGFLPSLFGYAVVPEKYREIVELHLIEEHEAEITARKQALHARLRSRR